MFIQNSNVEDRTRNNILQDIVHNYNNTYHNIIKITLSETQKKEKCKCIISYF